MTVIIDYPEISIVGVNGIPFVEITGGVSRGFSLRVDNVPPLINMLGDPAGPGWWKAHTPYFSTNQCVNMPSGETCEVTDDPGGYRLTITVFYGDFLTPSHDSYLIYPENGKAYAFDCTTESLVVIGVFVRSGPSLAYPLLMAKPGDLTIDWIDKTEWYNPETGDLGVRFEVFYESQEQAGAMRRGRVFFKGDSYYPPMGTPLPVNMSTGVSGIPEGSWWYGMCDLDIRWRKIAWDGVPWGGGAFFLRNAVELTPDLPEVPEFRGFLLESLERVQ